MWGKYPSATRNELGLSRIDLAHSMVPACIGGVAEKYTIGGEIVCRIFWGRAVDAPSTFFNITRDIKAGIPVAHECKAFRKVDRKLETNAAAWALGYVNSTSQEWKGRRCTTKTTVSTNLWPLYVSAQLRAAGLNVR